MTLDERIAQIRAQRPNPCRTPKAIVAAIATEVAAGTGLPLSSILSPRRDAALAQARQVVMFEARQRGLSYPAIGYAMNRDHTTIIHGVRREAERRGVSA